jgi:hypothetical protein
MQPLDATEPEFHKCETHFTRVIKLIKVENSIQHPFRGIETTTETAPQNASKRLL